MRKAFAATVLTLSVVLGLAACSSGSSSSTKSSSTSKAGTKVPVSLSGSVTNKGTTDISGKGASTSITLETDDFYFKPTFIKVGPGQKVKVRIKNEGSVAHTFTSPALSVDKEVAPGSQATVEITVPAAGKAAFFCRFHRDSGMQGAMFTTGG